MEQEETTKRSFLLIPLILIQGMISSPEILEDMLAAGLYLLAKKRHPDPGNYIWHFSKDFLDCPHLVADLVAKWRDELEELSKHIYFPSTRWLDEDDLKRYIKTHPALGEDIRDFYSMYQTLSEMSGNYDIPYWKMAERGRFLYLQHNKFEDEPFFAVGWSNFMKLYLARNRSTEEYRAQQAMYFGMLSIIGTKPMAATSSDAIKSRMFGAKNKDVLELILSDPETRKSYDYWTTRRRYEHLLCQVEEWHKVMSQGYGRSTYISFSYDTNTRFVNAILAYRTQVQAKREERRKMLKSKIKKLHDAQ